MHRLRDEVLAEDRPHGGAAVAPAREGGGAGSFELEIEPAALAIDQLTEEQGPPVAELRVEAAELVAGVGLGQGPRVPRQGGAREEARGERRVDLRQAQAHPEILIEPDEARRWEALGLPRGVSAFELIGEGVL